MPKEPIKPHKVNEIINNLIDQKGHGAIQKESLPHKKQYLALLSITPTGYYCSTIGSTITVLLQYYWGRGNGGTE